MIDDRNKLHRFLADLEDVAAPIMWRGNIEEFLLREYGVAAGTSLNPRPPRKPKFSIGDDSCEDLLVDPPNIIPKLAEMTVLPPVKPPSTASVEPTSDTSLERHSFVPVERKSESSAPELELPAEELPAEALFDLNAEMAENCNGRLKDDEDVSQMHNEEHGLEPGNRSLDEIRSDWRNGLAVTKGEALRLLNRCLIKLRDLETRLSNEDAIVVRRVYYKKDYTAVPFRNYDYKYVVESCCENVIGYLPVPVGVVGPLLVNKEAIIVPMATTEGALIASTMRGCKAIELAGGVRSRVYRVGMTRSPVSSFPNVEEAVNFKNWLDIEKNYNQMKAEFEATSRFAQLKSARVDIDGNLAFVRFCAFTGDAMGMNMVSKASSNAMRFLMKQFPNMKMRALSGNMCVDKKCSAMNWINGRGHSVSAECIFSAKIIKEIFKTTARNIEHAADAKLKVGSSRAGGIGANNAHAANIVAATFIATGQDPAQVVSSSMCSTRMRADEDGSLRVSVTLPSLEVGTVGGGTILPAQRQLLASMGCAGPAKNPGDNSRRLAEIITAAVLAGEVSLMAALCTDDLVASHMKLNRSKLQLYTEKEDSPVIRLDVAQRSMAGNPHARGKRIDRVECSNIL